MGAVYLEEHDCYIRYVELHGIEPTRLFISGLAGAASNQYAGTATHPALAGHRTLLVDLLGCGSSDRPRTFSYTIDDHARAVARVLDEVGITSCHVIAHSVGGAVGIWLAALRPNIISHLVLLEANLDAGSGSVTGSVSRQTEQEFFDTGWGRLNDMVRNQDPDWAGVVQVSDPYAVYWTARSTFDGTQPTMRQMLIDLPMPRTYVVGERSRPRNDLPAYGIPTPVVPKAGHGMVRDNPDGLAQVIANALRRQA